MTLSLTAEKSNTLNGTVTVPGDKSISHRCLILGSQCLGTTEITGLLEGEDVLKTADALREMGVVIARKETGKWVVNGVGVGGLFPPDRVLDMGNSGTATRLLMGLVAPYEFSSIFDGDASLCTRPMGRVINPLSEMGVAVIAKDGGRLPLTLMGAEDTLPIDYISPVASAQVKSCVLLAGLNTAGATSVTETTPTRDHTEKMLAYLGADIVIKDLPEGQRKVTLKGFPTLEARALNVPGDPSSAAFLVVAALLVPGSELVIENICMNVLRTGIFETLVDMGADLRFENKRVEAGEDIADLHVKHSPLKGITVPASRVSRMIDEFPVFSVAASFAMGTTVMEDLGELRVKESDRLAVMAEGLAKCGVEVKEGETTLTVYGKGPGSVAGGQEIDSHLDHRIAMAFLVMGLASEKPITVQGADTIQTSFPTFKDLMNEIGGKISE
ncbi:MAG: 3-phosphoshikimate 1-carboxyvinyltransferase [Alphaproteobacteria bacterium]